MDPWKWLATNKAEMFDYVEPYEGAIETVNRLYKLTRVVRYL